VSELRNTYNVLVGEPERKGLLRRPRRRWVDSIRMVLKVMVRDGVEWINWFRTESSDGLL
jgi:hypothetical protein